MSTIAYTRTRPPAGNDRYTIVAWAALASGDDGLPLEYAQLADRTVQAGGTFDGGTVVIEGSVDGVTYHTLTDPQGNALSFTSGGLEAITEVVAYIRPRVTGGGAGTSINANILMRE